MKTKFLVLMICALGLAACNPAGQDTATTTPTAQAPAAQPTKPAEPVVAAAPAAPDGSHRVAAIVGEGPSTPLRMTSGQSINGSYTPTKDGSLVAFGVYIGNSRQTSDGGLTLSLCQAQECQDVTVPLANTRDNDFLIFNLNHAIVVSSKQALTYKLLRSSDATRPVAVWTYPAPTGVATLTDTDGQDTGRIPKVAMYLEHSAP